MGLDAVEERNVSSERFGGPVAPPVGHGRVHRAGIVLHHEGHFHAHAVTLERDVAVFRTIGQGTPVAFLEKLADLGKIVEPDGDVDVGMCASHATDMEVDSPSAE